MYDMEFDVKAAEADIEATSDLFERALKLAEAERLAALPAFGVLDELRQLRKEVGNG